MKTFRIISALFAMLLSAFSAYPELRQLECVNLLNADGLMTTTVNDLAQDKKGYIWIGTPYGLYRHDGINVWKYFDDGDSLGLSSNLIRKVEADTLRDKVWVGTNLAGLCVFDCRTEEFTRIRHAENDGKSLSSDVINDIEADAEGRIWIATDKGVDLYDYSTGDFTRYNSSSVKDFPSGAVNRLLSDGDDLWIGHSSHGLLRMNIQEGKVKGRYPANSNMPSGAVRALCKGKGDTLWIGTDAGLAVMDARREEISRFRNLKQGEEALSHAIYDIERTADGHIWVGTLSNICYLHEADAKEALESGTRIHHMFVRDYKWGIANPSVYALMEDCFGNLWAGSNGGGASYINRERGNFSSWRIDKIPGVTNGLNDKEALALRLTASEDTLLIGTDGGGVTVNVKGINRRFISPYNSELKSVTYFDIIPGKASGTYLLSSYMGLEEIDMAKGKIRLLAQPRYQYPFATMWDHEGKLWMGYSDGALITLDSNGAIIGEHSSKNSMLPPRGITALHEDKDGDVWIGTYGCGLYVYGRVTGEIEASPIFGRACTVNHIMTDKRLNTWIATDIGLVKIGAETPGYEIYNEKDGLECASVMSLVEDGKGNIWLSTNAGISCYVADEGKFLNFGEKEGVLPGPYLRHSCARKSDGMIYMGSMNGVCYFNEEDLRHSESVASPVFTSFTILGNSIKDKHSNMPIGDGKITLSHEQNTFTVTFSPMNRALAEKCVYCYRMGDSPSDWMEIGYEPRLTFHNLPAGTHRLQVKAKLVNQDWPEQASELKIRIKPSPWASPWAKILYAALAIGAVYCVYVLRRHLLSMARRHREMEKEVKQSKTMRQALIDSSLNESDKAFAQRLAGIVEERLQEENCDVNEIARQMGVSYSTLYRKVKDITGSNISDFIKRVRVHQAEKLLLTGKYSVSEIAGMVGLSSTSYFRECFKKEFGASPTQWIKRLKS
ncbi:MAG: helix-turn-helix domain-containing protein [Clostridium sp.]|nr:helix-turn-helix domain-containing protein [Clostridium sp.]